MWPGPISVSILIEDPHEVNSLTAFWLNHPRVQENVDFHLVFQNQVRNLNPFPGILLKNRKIHSGGLNGPFR